MISVGKSLNLSLDVIVIVRVVDGMYNEAARMTSYSTARAYVENYRCRSQLLDSYRSQTWLLRLTIHILYIHAVKVCIIYAKRPSHTVQLYKLPLPTVIAFVDRTNA